MTTSGRVLDPHLSLALALQSNKGGYAVLLGSGVSRAAGIPTGWEIVLDMLRKLSALEGEGFDSESELITWYRDRYGAEPTYTDLLSRLASTPAERRELLRPYFEPTAEEREEGTKVPTRAHHALAKLVADGAIRVVITTNFDQLTETALREQGISPVVISSADAVEGMMPLHSSPATLIKLHGDYLDTRIKNTPDEVSSYDPPVDRLLDRILDEYGLIVCGWSAAWDTALSAAMLRCPSRRFTTFWAAHGDVGEEAQRLISHRKAQVITVESADAFFDLVAENVATLEDLKAPHPLTIDVAVATLKRYLPVPEQRIRLEDLLSGEVDRVASVSRAAIEAAPRTLAGLVSLLPRVEASSQIATTLMATGVFWGEDRHRGIWVRMLERLANTGRDPSPSSGDHFERLKKYPAQLAFYGTGLTAVARGREAEETLLDLLIEPTVRGGHRKELRPAASELSLADVVSHDLAQKLPGYDRRLTPFSDHLHDILKPVLANTIPAAVFSDVFDRFEYLVALAYAGIRIQSTPTSVWAPVGRLAWRREQVESALTDTIAADIRRDGPSWLLLRRGLYGGSPDVLLQAKAEIDALLARRSW